MIIASPDGAPEIEKQLLRIKQISNFRILIQSQPNGMGDAIWQARNIVKTPCTLVVWGDQVCLRKETVLLSMAVHQRNSNNLLTFPTVMKKDPYIDIQRDENGKIMKVLQRREGEIKIEIGENDCGLFAFSTDALFSVLHNGMNSNSYLGAKTEEINLLQFFPDFEKLEGSVTTLRIAHEEETLGVNTINEAKQVESILLKQRNSFKSKKLNVSSS